MNIRKSKSNAGTLRAKTNWLCLLVLTVAPCFAEAGAQTTAFT